METISATCQAGQEKYIEITHREESAEEEEEYEEEENNEESEQKSGNQTMTEEESATESEKPPAKRSIWVPFVFAKSDKEVLHYVGQDIKIQEAFDCYGGTTWPGALALCKYLENHQQQINLRDKAVLEIGSGTGLVSIVASLLGAFVTCTDLPEVLSNMRFNLSRNTRGRCRYTPQAAALSWGYDLEDTYPKSVYRYDYLLAADVVYAHNFLGELLATMKHFCQSGTTLIWANRVRFKSDLSFTEDFKKAFHTTLLLEEDAMKIYMATCREEVNESIVETVQKEETTEEKHDNEWDNVEEEEKEQVSDEEDKESLYNNANKTKDHTENDESEEDTEDEDLEIVVEQSLDKHKVIKEGKETSEELDYEDEAEGCGHLSKEDTSDHEDKDYDVEGHKLLPYSSNGASSDFKDEDLIEEGAVNEMGEEEQNIPAWASWRYSKHGKNVYFYVGQDIDISECLDSYGAVMWSGALALSHYLDTNRQRVNLEDKKVLELGSRTGLVSIVASLLGAAVTATDLPDVLPNLTSNIMRNTQQVYRHTPQVKALSWGYDLEHIYPRLVYCYDYVLAADVVYAHNFLSELLATMKHFCQCKTTLIWANKIRFDSDRKFTENFKKAFQTTLLAELGGVNIYMATLQGN